MSDKILVAYATRYGSTKEVAESVAATLRQGGSEVDLQPMKAVQTLEGYGAVVLGSPLYIGKWLKDAANFLARHQTALTQRRVAVFALGPTSTEEQEMQGSRAQLDQNLAQYPWLKPVALEVFIGKYDPAKLSLLHRLLAMLPASPLHNMPASDNRNWDAIRAWAESLRPLLQ
jgi:menaquinone-dependent protoporphyrinogen oxidase